MSGKIYGFFQQKYGVLEEIHQGDSGGPLFCDDNVLYGIVSSGHDCGNWLPQMFTKIPAFLDWIDRAKLYLSGYSL